MLMSMRRWLQLRFAIPALLLVIGLGVLVFWLVAERANKTKSEETQTALSSGQCDDAALKDLEGLQRSAKGDKAKEAKYIEERGICYVFRKDYDKAAETYQLAVDTYKQANLNEDATRVQGALNGVKIFKAEEEAAKMQEGIEQSVDDEVSGGT